MFTNSVQLSMSTNTQVPYILQAIGLCPRRRREGRKEGGSIQLLRACTTNIFELIVDNSPTFCVDQMFDCLVLLVGGKCEGVHELGLPVVPEGLTF